MRNLPPQLSQPEGLYIHVPFCARKCGYCAFYSEASSGDWMNRYVSALTREMDLVSARPFRPNTIFFGGGTPSLLNCRQWESILDAMDRLRLTGASEWTVECNPATVSLDKARLLRDRGVNRISMGVQSLDEALLDRLGRIHTRSMVFKSFDLLRKAGFDNLNIDLMFAIPGQTMEVWRKTLIEGLALKSEHLSCYEVIYEEDTPLFAQLHSGKFQPDEDLACSMYEELVDQAENAGLRQYEVANFARGNREPDSIAGGGVSDTGCRGIEPGSEVPLPRALIASSASASRATAPVTPGAAPLTAGPFSLPHFASRHNVNYWRGGAFHGLGPSATGYVGGVRTKNSPNTASYCEQLEKGIRAIESCEELPPLARAGETAAFGLRMVAGWPFDEFRRVTGFDLRREWSGEMRQLAGRGWGRIGADRFQLTREGLRFADAAAELFLRTF